MRYAENVLQLIGRTPLVRLNRVAKDVKPTILVKVESLNPGGSVKDRIGLTMIEAAEKEGLLKPGGTIVEATAGNTGAGLALAAAVKGYRCIFVLPDKMSDEKINLLKAYGSEVVVAPSDVAPDSPESYFGVADRLAREIPGAWRPNQHANQNNPRAHYETTGPEIWEDTDGKVDVLVAGMGTGGTISGTARYLKEKKPGVIVVGADPAGSILSGDAPHAYKVEGIGEDFIPATFDRQVVDDMVRVTDRESFLMARKLAREEGLLVGGSAGTAVAAALRYAQRLDKDKIVVVILPDTGRNYLSKIFSDKWLQGNGFLATPRMTASADDLLRARAHPGEIICVNPNDSPMRAAKLMQDAGVAQVPVIDGNTVVGGISELTLTRLLADGVDLSSSTVASIMAKPVPVIDASVDISEVYRLLLSGYSGAVVTRDGKPCGYLTHMDLVNFWMSKAHREAA